MILIHRNYQNIFEPLLSLLMLFLQAGALYSASGDSVTGRCLCVFSPVSLCAANGAACFISAPILGNFCSL